MFDHFLKLIYAIFVAVELRTYIPVLQADTITLEKENSTLCH